MLACPCWNDDETGNVLQGKHNKYIWSKEAPTLPDGSQPPCKTKQRDRKKQTCFSNCASPKLCSSASLSPGVLLPDMGLAHVGARIQMRPQCTLDAFFFEGSARKLEKPVCSLVLALCGVRHLLPVLTKKFFVHLHEAAVGARVCSHQVLARRLCRHGVLFCFQLLQLLLHRHRSPPEPDHIRVESVAVLGPRRSPYVGFQRPQSPYGCIREVPQGFRDVIRLHCGITYSMFAVLTLLLCGHPRLLAGEVPFPERLLFQAVALLTHGPGSTPTILLETGRDFGSPALVTFRLCCQPWPKLAAQTPLVIRHLLPVLGPLLWPRGFPKELPLC